MIIVGSLNSNKTELLVEHYTQLVQNGVAPQQILFLTLNSYKKEKITNIIKSFLPNITPNVQTFLGLCYNSILNNQPKLENKLPKSSKEEFILCGLEVSQNLFLEAVSEIGFKDYNSKINLVHQLLRRHSLIVSNNLTEKEIESKNSILNESFSKEADKAIELFKLKTLERRAFDYLRQQSLFRWIYKNTDALSHIKHIIVDDYDEQTPACTDFLKSMRNQLDSYTIGIDKDGVSRCGYLCADLNSVNVLNKSQNIIAAKESNYAKDFEFYKYAKRLELLNKCTEKITNLVKNGTSAEDISIISPVFDNQLKFVLQRAFDNSNINIQFISGSEKLADNALIKSVLGLLHLINGIEKRTEFYTDVLFNIFPVLLNIPIKNAYEVIKNFKNSGGFTRHNFLDDKMNIRYEKFLNLATKIKQNETLTSQLEKIYTDFICTEKISEKEIADYQFLSKQIRDIESTQKNPDKAKILNQISNSIIAENDINAQKLNRNSIIVGTPQKIIDLEVKTQYQFWLDTTDDEWIKQDTGTIYNAWVFAKSWNKPEFTYEDSIKCVEEKTKRQLRKLQLLAKNKIFIFAANYNSLGIENNLGITNLLKIPKKTQEKTTEVKWKFEPRPDQRPVMEYKSGKLALSAVPGAGKTTVLQALISKLIDSGVAAENIFVLTYMESAAKTLKDRLTKVLCPDDDNKKLIPLPNISTIHGLALRIIKENGNYSKINLGEDFEICDEILRQKIIQESIGELGLKYEEYEKFDRAISIAKFLSISSTPKTKETKEFLNFYKLYQLKLSEKNLIDYDDMLILAVKLLENNQDILNYYQNLCQYILEDEAQDSSKIQQRLINLLAGKYGNIVRCGDINQAITSTFTNADIEGFRHFIKNVKSVEMNQSQRCSEDIYNLANKLIDYSENETELNNAFYPIKMKGVAGKNPTCQNAVSSKIYEDESKEKASIVTTIKDLFNSKPDASAAILVRNNFQAAVYCNLLKENGIATISRSDCLGQSPIFNKILAILKFCQTPWDNVIVQEVYQTLFEIKENNLYLENLLIPFITVDSGILDDKNLLALHWELNYWLNQSNLPLEQLVLKIGEYYCIDEIDKSNLYIIAEIVRRFISHSTTNQEIITKLIQISKRPTIAGLKLFSQDENGLSTLMGGTVQVMTMHKAKGAEFDYVFVPELTEANIGTSLSSVKIGDYVAFYEELKSLDNAYKSKNALELKKEILNENLRLLYVTITRAKQKIFFSAPLKQKKFGRLKNCEPSKLFVKFFPN